MENPNQPSEQPENEYFEVSTDEVRPLLDEAVTQKKISGDEREEMEKILKRIGGGGTPGLPRPTGQDFESLTQTLEKAGVAREERARIILGLQNKYY